MRKFVLVALTLGIWVAGAAKNARRCHDHVRQPTGQ